MNRSRTILLDQYIHYDFKGDCSCTSKTAFEQMKKRWTDKDDRISERAMKDEVKVGHYYLNEKIKAVLKTLESADDDGVIRRNNAKGYRKENIPTSCKKHRTTIVK